MTVGLARRLTKHLRRFKRAESGVTAIEFAFIAPVVLLMSGIMLETGAVVFSEFSLQSGVQRAAREVKVGKAQGEAYSLTKFKERICSLARAGVKCSELNVYLKPASTFKNLYDTTPNILDIGTLDPKTGTKKSNYGCGAAEEAMVLVATYDWNFSLGYFMKPFGNINGGMTKRLVGLTVFKNEPFTSSGTCTTS